MNNTVEKNTRDLFIDALKGVAILLVVLGHAIQSTVPNFDADLLFRIIYSFHMPFFMFISGWVMVFSKSASKFIYFFQSKVKRLVIPFILWYLLNFILLAQYQSISLDQYLLNLVKSPDYGLWFLWVLFLCQVITFYSQKLEAYLGDLHFIIPYLVILFLPLHYFGGDLLKWHFKFFALGYLAAKHKEILIKKFKVVLPLFAAAFPVLVFYWHRTSEPSFMSLLRDYFPSELVSTFILDSYRFIVPISGTAFIILATLTLLNIFKSTQRYLSMLGLYTLEIYILHFYFVGKIALGDGLTKIFANFACALALSYVVTLLIKKSQYLSSALFGADIKKRLPD